MRTLIEAITVNFLLRGDAQRSYHDYLGVAFSLPFQSDTNTGMGVLFKAYSEALCHVADGGLATVEKLARKEEEGGATKAQRAAVAEAKEKVIELLDEGFPNVKNVKAELERGFRFWNLVRLSLAAGGVSRRCR
jgi:hypothetical protein